MITITGPGHQFVLSSHVIVLVAALAVWETVWRALAFWKAARNHQIAWFVVMAIVNTGGILEIIYLAFFQHDQNEHHAHSHAK